MTSTSLYFLLPVNRELLKLLFMLWHRSRKHYWSHVLWLFSFVLWVHIGYSTTVVYLYVVKMLGLYFLPQGNEELVWEFDLQYMNSSFGHCSLSSSISSLDLAIQCQGSVFSCLVIIPMGCLKETRLRLIKTKLLSLAQPVLSVPCLNWE